MARILLVWELGAALGHLARLAPLAGALRARGHEVEAIVPDVAAAAAPLPGIPLQAAPPLEAVAAPIHEPHSHAEILHDVGWCDPETLARQVAAWRDRLDRGADLAVLDSSPTALLAAQGLPLATALVGTGFSIPPDVAPLPELRPWAPTYPDRLRLREARVLAAADAVLAAAGQPPLPRLAALFGRANARLLATWPELDHFRDDRSGGEARYLGVWGRVPGAEPVWPSERRPRVLAYLHGFDALPELLAHWTRAGANVLVHFGEGVDAGLAGRLPAHVRVAPRPLDLDAAARACDLAVLHGGHDTTAHLLRAGRPLLLLPLQAEQALLARRVQAAGAARLAAPDAPAQVLAGFAAVAGDPACGAAARRLAERLAEPSPAEALTHAVHLLERLLAGPA